MCIRGGPITELEQEYMSKIVSDSLRDATAFGLPDLEVDIVIRNYSAFRKEFPISPIRPREAPFTRLRGQNACDHKLSQSAPTTTEILFTATTI